MSFFPNERTTGRVLAVVEVFLYALIGASSGLWWLSDTLAWPVAAFCYACLWAFAFNNITRVGRKRFFREVRFLGLKVAFLVLVGVGFGFGFFVAT